MVWNASNDSTVAAEPVSTMASPALLLSSLHNSIVVQQGLSIHPLMLSFHTGATRGRTRRLSTPAATADNGLPMTLLLTETYKLKPLSGGSVWIFLASHQEASSGDSYVPCGITPTLETLKTTPWPSGFHSPSFCKLVD